MRTQRAFQVWFTGPLKGRVATHFDRENAECAARRWPGSPGTVAEALVSIFDDGDTVEVELLCGAVEDDEGISRGGRWIVVRGIVRAMDCSPYHGWLMDTDGTPIQAMSLIAGAQGYPYRNARLVQAAAA